MLVFSLINHFQSGGVLIIEMQKFFYPDLLDGIYSLIKISKSVKRK